MALPSTIYRVAIQLSDVDRGVYETLQTTAARHPSETEDRLVARMLAYALFYEPELAFTKGLSAVDEPDLWLKGPDGRVRLWVEVGLPDAERIVKAGRHSERVVLVACGRTFLNWEQQHLPKLAGMSNLTLVCFGQSFINNLTARLDRTINWSVTVSDGCIYVDAGGETFEALLDVRAGER